MGESFLLSCFVFLAAACIMVPVSKLSGLGSVIGYLIAGILIGPFALGLVSDPETVLHFSEFGVVMMLFIIGLEVQPKALWKMRGSLFGLGGSQMIFTALLIGGAAMVLGRPWGAATIIGLALALSSTAIAIQIMQEKGILNTNVGRAGFSVLLLQDIAVIGIIAAIPILALYSGIDPAAREAANAAHGADSYSAGFKPTGWLFGLSVIGVFAAMIIFGRLALAPALKLITKAGVREIFTSVALLLVVGAALLMDWLGLSAALGAFIAGVVLADSDYRHQLERDIEPFKALLLGLFFISVGMSINFDVLAQNPLGVAGMVAGLVAIKSAVLWGIAKKAGLGSVGSLMLAALLCQGGEFAFVVFQYALAEGAMLASTASTLNAVVAISMAATPLLLIIFDKLIFPRLSGVKPAAQTEAMPDDMAAQVFVIGFGRAGQMITRILSSQGFGITIIDHDPDHIEFIKQFGYKVYYGSAVDTDLLQAASADTADLIVLAIDNRERSQKAAAAIKAAFPKAKLMVRARNRQHLYDLRALGIDAVERETFRSAVHMGEDALKLLGVSANRAAKAAKTFVDHDLELVEEQVKIKDDMPNLIKAGIKGRRNLEDTLKADRESGT